LISRLCFALLVRSTSTLMHSNLVLAYHAGVDAEHLSQVSWAREGGTLCTPLYAA